MTTTTRWEAKDVWRLVHISSAVVLIATTWGVAVLPHFGSQTAGAPWDVPPAKVSPSPAPGSAPLYWIRRINAPDVGTEPARALWITPQV